ncbi:MAG: MFS transporter [Brevundimonas sp.]|uniref:MFS transporter n=1 Tax=Brevundimonas sp. TaxID=1871086 RepID=UPI0039199F2C
MASEPLSVDAVRVRAAPSVGWTILLLAVAVASGSTIQSAFSPFAEITKADMGLSDLQLSYLQGLAIAVPAILVSIPLGWLVDHKTRRWLLVGMSLVWTAGQLMTVWADDFNTMMAARMVASLGGTCVLPIVISMAADLCRPETRGRSLLLLSIGKYVGTALAFGAGGALFGWLAARPEPLFEGLSAWRQAHLLVALASAGLTALFLIIREPERREVALKSASLGQSAAALWSRRAFLIPLFIGQISVIMADNAALTWTAPVLSRQFGLSPEDFAGWVGGLVLAAGVAGSVIGGIAADAGHRWRPGKGLLLGAVVASLIALPCAVFPLAPTVPMFALLLGVLLLAGTATGLLTATAIAVLVPNEFRGLCLGAFIVFGVLFGFGIAPTLVTVGSQILGGESQLGLSLAVVGLASGAIAVLAFVLAMMRAPSHSEDHASRTQAAA